MKLSDLGYPPEFIEAVGGNFELYPHQQEALGKLKDNRNLIVTVPTAAGKTLIAGKFGRRVQISSAEDWDRVLDLRTRSAAYPLNQCVLCINPGYH